MELFYDNGQEIRFKIHELKLNQQLNQQESFLFTVRFNLLF